MTDTYEDIKRKHTSRSNGQAARRRQGRSRSSAGAPIRCRKSTGFGPDGSLVESSTFSPGRKAPAKPSCSTCSPKSHAAGNGQTARQHHSVTS